MRIRGLLAFPLTPFTADDRFDRDVFVEHLSMQMASRRSVPGVGEMAPSAWFVACGTGEFSGLSIDEFRDVVGTAVTFVAGGAPVYAGAGGGPRIAREFAIAATECGADGILLLPPYLVRGTPAGLAEHVRYVAGSTSLPVVVYQRANAVLDPAAAVGLLDIPNVVGIKDGVGDIEAMSRIVSAVRLSGHPRAAEFGFLNGLPTAELSASAYQAIGADGYSSAVLSFAPAIATTFHHALNTADVGTTQMLTARFYLPFAALRQQVPGYAVALVKAGARIAGLPVGGVRPPLTDPTPEHVDQLARIIDDGLAALTGVPGTYESPGAVA